MSTNNSQAPHDLLDSWINGNRKTVRALLDHKQVRTFARMLEMARDEIREDLIRTFAEDAPRIATPAPIVRQTACRHCGQDIEQSRPRGLRTFKAGQWRDRGGNTTCPNEAGDAGQRHAPVAD